LLNCASIPFTALDASAISDKGRIEVTSASVPCRLDYCNAILAGTATTAIKRLQSVQKTMVRLLSETIFRNHYHYSMQPPLASGVAQNRFQEHNILSLHELCVPVEILICEVVLRCRYQLDIILPKVQTSIGKRSYAFYG